MSSLVDDYKNALLDFLSSFNKYGSSYQEIHDKIKSITFTESVIKSISKSFVDKEILEIPFYQKTNLAEIWNVLDDENKKTYSKRLEKIQGLATIFDFSKTIKNLTSSSSPKKSLSDDLPEMLSNLNLPEMLKDFDLPKMMENFDLPDMLKKYSPIVDEIKQMCSAELQGKIMAFVTKVQAQVMLLFSSNSDTLESFGLESKIQEIMGSIDLDFFKNLFQEFCDEAKEKFQIDVNNIQANLNPALIMKIQKELKKKNNITTKYIKIVQENFNLDSLLNLQKDTENIIDTKELQKLITGEGAQLVKELMSNYSGNPIFNTIKTQVMKALGLNAPKVNVDKKLSKEKRRRKARSAYRKKLRKDRRRKKH